jgi:TusA-related sulfurtransferase
MISMQLKDQRLEWVGEEWIQVLMEKDFNRLAEICQPTVLSRLMTPKRFDSFENVSDLIQKVDTWFHECSSFQKEQTHITKVGEKLAISYRLSFDKNGQPYEAEQQLYCTLRDGLIDQVNLLCSGFQPVQRMDEAPIRTVSSATIVQQPDMQGSLQADAFLKFDTNSEQGSTCAFMTPYIKRKLGEMSSGQVLEVQVDDFSAKDDIEAWCRLSGNPLLKLEQGKGQDLHFYVMKK